ncbi:tigr02452 family protein [Stemphylium lycopersici]|nr:tigr02452 family protein [Stemphylium lycopersici]
MAYMQMGVKRLGVLGDEERDGGKTRGKAKGKKRNDSLDEGLSSLNLKATAKVSTNKERSIRIISTDSLTAAHMLTHPSMYNTSTWPASSKSTGKKAQNTCILNMASPLRPGGGVYAGATSAEEFLCARSTLLPSLKEEYYRLPELGGIYTSDVLVLRNSESLGNSAGELSPGERWYVDVITAGMLRFPELEGEEDEEKRLGKKDRDVVERKIRSVLRMAERKGVRRLVLGAWGCGAYGNPVRDVAEAFRRVLDGTPTAGSKKGKAAMPPGKVETWACIEDVVFAIANRKMATDFAAAFGGKIEVEDGPGSVDAEDEDEEEDTVVEELRRKIEEMEGQISKVWNADLKMRMGVILDGLKAQLREREGTPETSVADDRDEEGEEGDEGEEDEEEEEEEEGEEGDEQDKEKDPWRTNDLLSLDERTPCEPGNTDDD